MKNQYSYIAFQYTSSQKIPYKDSLYDQATGLLIRRHRNQIQILLYRITINRFYWDVAPHRNSAIGAYFYQIPYLDPKFSAILALFAMLQNVTQIRQRVHKWFVWMEAI